MREFLEKYYLCVCLFLVAIINYGDGYWNFSWFWKWNLLCITLTVMVGYLLADRLHWAIVPAFLSTMIGSFRTWGWLDVEKAWLPFSLTLPADYRAASLGLTAMLFVMFFVLLPRRYLKTLCSLFCWLNIYTLGMVYVQYAFGAKPYWRAGIFGNASMNACFIAFTLPFVIFRQQYFIYDPKLRIIFQSIYSALCFFAILIASSTMGLVTLGAVLFSKLFQHAIKAKRFAYLVALLVVPLFLFGAGYLHEGHEFVSSSGRMDLWEHLMPIWYQKADIWTGAGVAIIYSWAPLIQKAFDPRARNFFIWLHSDWLQLLVEEGVIGLASYLLLYFVCLKRAFKSNYLFAALVGFGVCAGANYPMRLPIHAFFGASIVVMCLSLKIVRKA